MIDFQSIDESSILSTRSIFERSIMFITNWFRDVKHGIGNLIKWFPIIWKDRDWDHYFFHIMVRQKLENMEHLLRNYGHHVDAEKDADKIRVCVCLLNRIIDDEYHEMVYKDHDKKWGDTHFRWEEYDGNEDLCELHIDRDNVKTKEDKDQERKEFRALMHREGELKTQDLKYLYQTLAKYILHWWD